MQETLFPIEDFTGPGIRAVMDGKTCRQCGHRLRACYTTTSPSPSGKGRIAKAIRCAIPTRNWTPASPKSRPKIASLTNPANLSNNMNHEILTTCPNCGHEYDAHLHWLVCPKCGHETPKLQTEQPKTED